MYHRMIQRPGLAGLLCLLLSGIIAGFTAHADEIPVRNGYVASKEGLRSFFEAMSPFLDKPIIVSKAASKKQITGNFDFLDPMGVLEDLSRQMGLVWYSDGKSVFIYDNAELQHSLFMLRNIRLSEFNQFLKKTGIFDDRFVITGDDSGAFYVSGPPVYVELVLNAARLMDSSSDGLEMGRQKIGIIHLTNTFVNDRTYELRGEKIVVPGLAKIVRGLLNNEQVVRETLRSGQTTELATNQPQPAARFPPMPEFPRDGAESEELKLTSISTGEVTTGIEDIRVIAYPETNSLLIRGTVSQVDFIEKLIRALDVPKRHIELSLWIIDIEKTDLDRIGTDITGSFSVGSGLHFQFNPGDNLSTLDGTRFIAAVQALEQRKRATVVSRPVVLTQENIPAIFDNNRTFYAQLVGERNASLESVTYGTLISVLPRFGSGDQIELLLSIEDGNDYSSEENRVGDLPQVGRTLISTVARVPRGKSLLIGGYTRDAHSVERRKIPLLGDIPFLGALFRYQGNSDSNVVRVFLIQPQEIDERLMRDVNEIQNDVRSLSGQMVTERDIDDRTLQKWMDVYLNRNMGGLQNGS